MYYYYTGEITTTSSTTTTSEETGGAESMALSMDKSKLMSLLAQLRKASNHPFLFPGIEKVSTCWFTRSTCILSTCYIVLC